MQLTVSQANVGSAKAELDAKAAMAKRDELELGHYKAMSAGSFSMKEMEQAQANADASLAAVDAARRQLAAAERRSRWPRARSRPPGTRSPATPPTSVKSQLNLSYTTIIAPRDGRVTRKNVAPGAYVQPGQQLLAIVPYDVWVNANFKETQLTRMRPGQPVTIAVDAYPEHDLHGHVQSFQAGTGAAFSLLPPENATGNYVKVVQRVPVKIVFDAPPNKPGDGRKLAAG